MNNILEGHQDPESHIIGKITFDDILNEKKIQSNTKFNPKRIGECNIEIFANEGKIPHFHIYNNDMSFSICIRLYENLYFSHGGKYRDTFNSNQCRQLNNYLKQQYKNFLGIKMSVWEYMVFYWEDNNDTTYPHKVKVQPHYEDMNSFRDVI